MTTNILEKMVSEISYLEFNDLSENNMMISHRDMAQYLEKLDIVTKQISKLQCRAQFH